MSNSKKTLEASDIVSSSPMSRRGAMSVIGATVLGAAAAAIVSTPGSARATTDSDSGPNADQAGRGRSGVTDSDSGPNADGAGHGRGTRRRGGQTDSDSGPNADAAGRGRSGATDSDSGPNADRAGHGR